MKIDWKQLSLRKPRRLSAGGMRHDCPCPVPGSPYLVHRLRGQQGSGLVLTDQQGRLARPLVLDQGEYGRPQPGVGGGRLFFAWRAAGSDPWQLRTLELGGGAVAPLLESPSVSFVDPCPHPDGKRLIFASDEGSPGVRHLWELDLASGERRPLTSATRRADDQPALSPSGRSLAFRGKLDGVAELYLLDLEEGGTRQLTDARASSRHPCFLDDFRLIFGRVLAGGDRGLLMLDALRCKEAWLTGVVDRPAYPAVSVRGDGYQLWYSARSPEADSPAATDLYRARVRGLPRPPR